MSLSFGRCSLESKHCFGCQSSGEKGRGRKKRLPLTCPQVSQLPFPQLHSCSSTSLPPQMSLTPYGRGAGFLLQLSWGSRCKRCGPLHSQAHPLPAQLSTPPPPSPDPQSPHRSPALPLKGTRCPFLGSRVLLPARNP